MDGVSFEEFYDAHFVRAARLAHLLTGTDAHAEDIAQEALLRLGRRYSTVERPDAYLTTTVVNLCRNLARGQSRRERRERDTVRPGGSDAATGGEHGELLALVDALPFRQRTVLVARYWLGLSEAEIADVVGCRPGTVKSLASRALDALRKDLA